MAQVNRQTKVAIQSKEGKNDQRLRKRTWKIQKGKVIKKMCALPFLIVWKMFLVLATEINSGIN